MKKSLVAGAASLAFAAMPVVGVFATNPAAVQDQLTVTVNESCTFARVGGSDTITETMTAGQLKSDFGGNTFKSTCNNGKGYDINATFTDLTITSGTGAAITYDGTAAPTANSGTWNASVGGSILAKTGDVIGSRNTQDPSGGSTYTVSYAVSVHNDQAKGTYSGTATYSLVMKS